MNIRKTDMSRSSIPPSLPPYLLRAKPSVVRLHLPPFHQKNNLGSQGRGPSLSKGSVEDDHTLKEGGREGRREGGKVWSVFYQKDDFGSQGRGPSLSKGSVEDDHTLKEGGREGGREGARRKK